MGFLRQLCRFSSTAREAEFRTHDRIAGAIPDSYSGGPRALGAPDSRRRCQPRLAASGAPPDRKGPDASTDSSIEIGPVCISTKSGLGLGCVKTPKVQKRGEDSFSSRSKLTALENPHDAKREVTKGPFYQFSAPPRFHTTRDS